MYEKCPICGSEQLFTKSPLQQHPVNGAVKFLHLSTGCLDCKANFVTEEQSIANRVSARNAAGFYG